MDDDTKCGPNHEAPGLPSAPDKRLYVGEVMVLYGVFAASAKEALKHAAQAVADTDAGTLIDSAEVRLAVADLYAPPNSEGDEHVYGDHTGDLTWDAAVVLDRASDPEAAARADARIAQLNAVRDRVIKGLTT